MAYITVDELKDYLKIGDDEDDALLAALISSAESIFEGPDMTGRAFEASADTTRNFDAYADTDGYTLWLDEDLCAITSITNGDGDVLTTAEYTTQPRNETPYYAIKLLASSGLTWETDSNGDPEDAIAIVGRWAYSTTPDEKVKHAIKRLAAWLYRQKDTSADLDRPFIAQSGVTIMPSAMPQDVVQLARSLSRVRLA